MPIHRVSDEDLDAHIKAIERTGKERVLSFQPHGHGSWVVLTETIPRPRRETR